jgi:TldD protein
MIEDLKDALQGLDVEYADIRVEDAERTAVVYRGKELEDIVRNFELGGCLRVFKNGNWAVASFNKVEGSLNELARETAAKLNLLPHKNEHLLSMPAADEMIEIDPEIDPRSVTLEQKHDLIRGYNEILLKNSKVASTAAVYADAFVKCFFCSTEDRHLAQERVHTGVFLNVTARDGTNVQSYTRSFGKAEGFDSLKGLEPEVETIAGIAIDLLGAEKVTAGRYDVVIDPLLAGVFAHEAFGHLSEADFMYQNPPVRELMKVGTQYGIDELSIVDDGTMARERGSLAFDEEGVPSRKTYLLKNGRIAGHLHSRQTAAKMGESLTGNCRAISYRFAPIVRMTNTYIEPRSVSLEQMLGEMKSGLYVVGALGGMTELESFTFSSQYAWLVENGRKTKLIRDVILSGNIFDTLRRIDAIGNDLKLHGGLGGCGKADQSPLPVGDGGPHVRIRDVVIGGK